MKPIRKLRFHVTSLPHTRVSKEYSACAYTAKVFNFCKMMVSLGHDVFLYAPEGSDAPCTELIQTASRAEQEQWFGVYDWHAKMFNIEWNDQRDYWKVTNLRSAAEISKRAQKGDMVCIVGGACQKPMADQLDQTIVAVTEPFIGYRGVFTRYQVYESHTHLSMNAIRSGLNNPHDRFDPNGDNYWDVVPVYFDPDDFPIGHGQGDEKGPYYAYIGRLIQRKGIRIAAATCQAIGARLKIAGQGVRHWDAETKTLTTDEGEVFQGDHIDYIGFADVATRAKLLGGATAVFTPTIYFEPGGNTSVEPQACGTPVLATNFGCFTQQVINGITGYRCRTLDQWAWCAKQAANLDRTRVRQVALARHSLDVVRWQFDEFFQGVYDLYLADGWNTIHPDRVAYPVFA